MIVEATAHIGALTVEVGRADVARAGGISAAWPGRDGRPAAAGHDTVWPDRRRSATSGGDSAAGAARNRSSAASDGGAIRSSRRGSFPAGRCRIAVRPDDGCSGLSTADGIAARSGYGTALTASDDSGPTRAGIARRPWSRR